MLAEVLGIVADVSEVTPRVIVEVPNVRVGMSDVVAIETSIEDGVATIELIVDDAVGRTEPFIYQIKHRKTYL